MKLRTKLKREKNRVQVLEEALLGMERGKKYLYDLCERVEAEKKREVATLKTTKDLLRMILERIVVEAGSIELRTDDMKETIEKYDIKYHVETEGHRIQITAEKKQGI